jgi:hypothetical protein
VRGECVAAGTGLWQVLQLRCRLRADWGDCDWRMMHDALTLALLSCCSSRVSPQQLYGGSCYIVEPSKS